MVHGVVSRHLPMAALLDRFGNLFILTTTTHKASPGRYLPDYGRAG